MAKCDLSIELDDPDGIHCGGGMISGVVHVRADADVNCSALVVKSVWKTHGRGNVTSGEAGSVTLYQGQWQAGQQNDYRFELPIADWPPTYHGFHLNIDHSIEARAKVPWSFDPKASTTFLMQPTGGSDGVIPPGVTALQGTAAKVIIIAVVMGFVSIGMVVAANIGGFGFIFLIFPVLAAVFWLVRVALPKWALGDVKCELASESFVPGETVTGELVIEPRKRVSINGISLGLVAEEKCISGSGSNRTTHRHTLFEKVKSLSESTNLSPGKKHRFAISVRLPDEAAHSIRVKDNELNWNLAVRVDIPRWPDWVKNLPVTVVPSGKPATRQASGTTATHTASSPVTASPENEGGITFAETARHLWSVRDDREQVEMLVEAVSGMTFDIEAAIERRLLYAGDDDPHVYKDGFAVWARYPDPALPMVLYVPHHLGDEFEQIGNQVWRGRGTIVGWDSRHGRLQIKL